jgi:hypothetical protein
MFSPAMMCLLPAMVVTLGHAATTPNAVVPAFRVIAPPEIDGNLDGGSAGGTRRLCRVAP